MTTQAQSETVEAWLAFAMITDALFAIMENYHDGVYPVPPGFMKEMMPLGALLIHRPAKPNGIQASECFIVQFPFLCLLPYLMDPMSQNWIVIYLSKYMQCVKSPFLHRAFRQMSTEKPYAPSSLQRWILMVADPKTTQQHRS